MLNNGDLYIYNAGPSDGYKSYACRTVHRLTGDVQASAYPGRIIITGEFLRYIRNNVKTMVLQDSRLTGEKKDSC